MSATMRSIVCLHICLLPLPVGAEDRQNRHADQPAGQTLTVAVVSPRCVFGDVKENLAHFEELTAQAARKGARLVCFP